MLTCLDLDEDEMATKLLDKGLRVAFFRETDKGNADELEVQKKVLESFPRTRVGVSSKVNISLNGEDQTTAKEKMAELISACGEDAMSFYFEVTANASPAKNDSDSECNETIEKDRTEILEKIVASVTRELASHAKTVVKEFEEKHHDQGKRLQIYLQSRFSRLVHR